LGKVGESSNQRRELCFIEFFPSIGSPPWRQGGLINIKGCDRSFFNNIFCNNIVTTEFKEVNFNLKKNKYLFKYLEISKVRKHTIKMEKIWSLA